MLSAPAKRAISATVPCHRYYSTKAKDVWKESHSASFYAAAKQISSIPKSTGVPEIIVTGRANAGKSTLLNAVLGRTTLLSTSKKAGHTKSLNFYAIGSEPAKLYLVDAPGYGARGRPEWGALFDHYVQNREELKRVYILFNAKHGLNQFDIHMLSHLSQFLMTDRGVQPFTLQSVITKADIIPIDDTRAIIEKMRSEIFAAAPLCLPPIVTSAAMNPPFGLDALRSNIADACGFR
ncbi:P-loop containing nucleoside triphosphate hydrolase protein [Pholiota conissans]|uniref:P-loop containing nucleoside triphosphate hydrolase protein n=1 Tax=Pholiota conissans TaxID=109636 RepID=A0A9P5Z9D7_9AGAR|nr:P-loop containing nucleoside triphosphate hydrolase protein [Pholiota conissans]